MLEGQGCRFYQLYHKLQWAFNSHQMEFFEQSFYYEKQNGSEFNLYKFFLHTINFLCIWYITLVKRQQDVKVIFISTCETDTRDYAKLGDFSFTRGTNFCFFKNCWGGMWLLSLSLKLDSSYKKLFFIFNPFFFYFCKNVSILIK